MARQEARWDLTALLAARRLEHEEESWAQLSAGLAESALQLEARGAAPDVAVEAVATQSEHTLRLPAAAAKACDRITVQVRPAVARAVGATVPLRHCAKVHPTNLHGARVSRAVARAGGHAEARPAARADGERAH
eukprot:SAG11_NODE_3537_length_2386_cov_1.154351_1_plen_135_part_00